ncbi:glycosyl transferase [Lentzea sp. NBRC 105346]|uniref:glycosyltransferase n=1 Tax=Lentzea sp. NBRC 105346 TaxID=3032205 RepID=UPI0024A3662F|nr:glycosyltransferase [Lentzea sp. NBRC 105346]GLZ33418.1 glycosyl transferase [Lentzea sp. NBRC 105346]
MKIAMVSVHASPLTPDSGQSLHVASLSAALVRLGHEVTVYTRRDAEGLLSEITTPDGYQVVHVPAGPARQVKPDARMGDFAQFLLDDWGVRRPDLVHAHYWTSGLVSLLAAQRHGIPVVQSYHGLGARSRGEEMVRRISTERLVGREAELVVATCEDEVHELVGMGIARAKIEIVPRGVDPELFGSRGAAAQKTAPQRIVSVGKLLPHNGFADLVAALPRLLDTELVIAGRGTRAEERRLQGWARKLGVADRMMLAGHVARKDMPALLRSADVVACVPWVESYGVVPLEAMACGVPVVASAVGGLTDIVIDHVTGVLVPPRDLKRLIRALRVMLSDSTLRGTCGVAGEDRIRARHTWSEVAKRVERLYQRVEQPVAARS